MPFGQSSVNAPPTADAVAAARWSSREGVSTSQLRNACPASDAQTALDQLEKAHPDCQRAVVVVTPERTKSKLGTSIAGRTIRLVRRQKDNTAPLYAVAPSSEAWPELWRKDAAEAARLLEDESDAGIAFREARAARIRCDVQISSKTDWADPTGEKAAKAEAEAKAEREAAEARRKKSSALPIGFGSKKKGHAALFGGSKKTSSSKKKKPAPVVNKKKRRIVESDDDEEEDDGDSVEVASPEEDERPPMEEARRGVPSTPSPRRRLNSVAHRPRPPQEEEAPPPPPKEEAKPGMKLVEKTYVDPNGYFCTQQVWVKDESAATKMEISAPKAKPAAPKPKGLPKPKPAPKKKLKKGQTSLSSFFAKK